MRIALAAAAIVVATSAFNGVPAQAQQGGTFMWCTAWTEKEANRAYFYSAFFAAGSWETERRALSFKLAVQTKEAGVGVVKATCMEPEEYDRAVAMRNAAMKAAPGKIISWEG